MSEKISDTLLFQRVRNRQIERLSTAASFNETAQYGVYETINLWDDFFQPESREFYCPPIYSQEEVEALWSFHNIVEKEADNLPDDCWDSEELAANVHWAKVREVAVKSNSTFKKRGFFSEEEEGF